MIQIIGWLGCAMLAVKLLEMGANPALKKEEGGIPKDSIVIAIVFGWASVFGFAYWLAVQGDAFPEPMRTPDSIGAYSDVEDAEALADEAERTADCVEALADMSKPVPEGC